MRQVTVTVGPLAAASATNVVASQSPAKASQLVLNGTLGTGAVANSIALSQTLAGATTVVLNGALGNAPIPQTGTKGAFLPSSQYIYITSAGNDSGVTFVVVGLDVNGTVVSEGIGGSNAGVASSLKQYRSIISITSSGATASTITVGQYTPVTLDTPRQIIITTASTISFTITGTDWAGNPISETVTNAGASVSSVLSYATVTSVLTASAATSVTVGTTGVAYSPWVSFDDWANPTIAIQCNASGTVSYTVQQSLDNPNSPTNPVAASSMVWANSGDANAVNATGSIQTNYFACPVYGRVLLNSGTGSVTVRYSQASVVPY